MTFLHNTEVGSPVIVSSNTTVEGRNTYIISPIYTPHVSVVLLVCLVNLIDSMIPYRHVCLSVFPPFPRS